MGTFTEVSRLSRDGVLLKLLLLGAFFAFSFNNFSYSEYYFPAGQATFYFLMLAMLFGARTAKDSTIRFIVAISGYILLSALLTCASGGGCTSRPITGLMTILLLIFAVDFVANIVERESGLEAQIERALVGAAWMVVLFAFPDIIAIQVGDIQASFLEPSAFRYSVDPYTTPRLRGFTQEPSYLGMVIAVLYPLVLLRLEKRVSVSTLVLLLGLWICLFFSLSKTGLATCILITLFWALRRMRSTFILVAVGSMTTFVAVYFGALDLLLEGNEAYLNQWTEDGIDISTLTRVGHMVAALNLWLDNLLMGAGLGQSGYFLPDYYPDWIWASPEAPMWAAAAANGGVPTFAFLPKLLAEIGLIGAVFLLIKTWPLLRTVRKYWSTEYYVRAYASSVVCFLIASFGVEGWLYMAAWLVFGVLVGICRRIERAPHPTCDGSTR